MNLSPGQTVSLIIEDIAFGGEGVGRVDDFVVFVPFVLVGEMVEAEITEVKKSFARARLLRVVNPSPERVEAPCRYFGACGGCQYQHVAYETQLRLKHKQIADLFQRIGGFRQEVVAPVIPCPQPYGYRNRIMIRSQWNKPEQKLNIGFIRWDCGLVEDITECKIAEPALNEQISRVRANPPPKGGIKVVLRISPSDLVARASRPFDSHGQDPRATPNWEVPPDSFFQNNFFLLPKLVETVRNCLRDVQDKAPPAGLEVGRDTPCAPGPGAGENGAHGVTRPTSHGARHLVDLYCGVGFFAIELADTVESFVGVEYDKLAIQAARRNAAAHGRTNGEFLSATVEDALPQLLKRFSPSASAALLDPPRKGCQPATLQLLRQERPAQIIYVSCHPATMARDLNILCREGVFELVSVVPLDMFPQTQHVECVADLRRTEKVES